MASERLQDIDEDRPMSYQPPTAPSSHPPPSLSKASNPTALSQSTASSRSSHSALLRLLESAGASHDLVNLAKMEPGLDIDTITSAHFLDEHSNSCDTLPRPPAYCSVVAQHPVSLRLFLCLPVEFSKHSFAGSTENSSCSGAAEQAFLSRRIVTTKADDCIDFLQFLLRDQGPRWHFGRRKKANFTR